MKNIVEKVQITYAVRDVETKRVLRIGTKQNLLFDNGLNRIASGAAKGFGGCFQTCKIGSGAMVNQIGSGATTFSQSGTQLTASTVGWFNTNAIAAGWLMKMGTGTGGRETYIVSIDGPGTVATMTDSATMSATVATAWNVAQTSGAGWLYKSNTYSTGNGQSISGNQITLTRVFVFAQQGSNYNVTWIGYTDNAAADGTVNGAVVVTPFTVTNTQFLQVTIQIVFAVTPGAPASVGNVTTGFNSAGNVMCNLWDFAGVATDGTPADYQHSFSADLMDYGKACFAFYTAAFSQPGSIQQSQYAFGGLYPSNQANFNTQLADNTKPGWNGSANVGTFYASCAVSTTTAGETINAIAFGGLKFDSSPQLLGAVFTLNLTTPLVLPSGAFSCSMQLLRTVSRTLTN